uniref:Glycine N-acyltransferase-like protein n=1 Tax=Acrobeloides nanus TaxID=290746 RepID=A0A914C823_9BILA
MTTEQQEKLLALEITLPKEYNFGKLEDEDFEKIVLSRDKGQPQDIPHIRAILTCMPSSIIKKNDEVVAYEMVDPSGFLKAHYVFPVHRGNGLGNAIERDLCKKCIR